MRAGDRRTRAVRVLLTVHALRRRLLAEGVGSAVLTAVVVGSGIAAQTLSPHDVGLQLLENAAATAAGLYVLISLLGPVSGAHPNPVVTLAELALRRTTVRDAAGYVVVQVVGCCLGALLANAMFARATVEISRHHRATGPHLLAEAVATAGLLLTVLGLAGTTRTAGAVAAYVGAAYFFTSSTSFANPAIAVGRMLTDTFAGIAPASVPAFVVAELVGGALGLALTLALFGRPDRR